MKNRGKLTPEQIVESALALLDEFGEADFSMRKLASLLNVDPMAIYYHFSNKAELLHRVMQEMMMQCEIPVLCNDWQKDILNLCNSLRKLAKSHPGSFQVYETYNHWLPAEHRLHEAFHLVLLKAGFSKVSTVRGAGVLLAYTEAHVIDEIAGWLVPRDRDELQVSLEAGEYPTLVSLVKEITSNDPEADFRFGLNLIIAGLETELKGAAN
ncbi:MAG: TetR/AcrR family transcriptional regulator [Pseudomonadota bacterium]